jgi:exodeoxyribonuclease VII large subunit
MGARLARADVTLRSAVRADVDAANARLRRRLAQLEALSPLAVLGRGYAVCWDEDGRTILRRADPALEGRDVHVRLAEGTLDCRVTRARSPERPR